jgi:hypothetical protein
VEILSPVMVLYIRCVGFMFGYDHVLATRLQYNEYTSLFLVWCIIRYGAVQRMGGVVCICDSHIWSPGER